MNTTKAIKKFSVLAIVFYVIAVLMLIMAIYFGNDALQYVKEYAEGYGMSLKDMKKDAFGYIAQAALPYVIYAIICFGFGRLLWEIANVKALFQAASAVGGAAAVQLAEVGAAGAAIAAAEAAAYEAEEAVETAEEAVVEMEDVAEEAIDEAAEIVEDAEEAAAEAVEEAEEAAAEAIEETEEAAAEAALETIEEAEPKENE